MARWWGWPVSPAVIVPVLWTIGCGGHATAQEPSVHEQSTGGDGSDVAIGAGGGPNPTSDSSDAEAQEGHLDVRDAGLDRSVLPDDERAVPETPVCLGGTPLLIAANVRPTALAISSTHLYWLDADLSAVMRQSKTSGLVEKVADMSSLGHAIEVDESRFYWEEAATSTGFGMAENVFSRPLDLTTGAIPMAVGTKVWGLGGDRFYFSAIVLTGTESGYVEEIRFVPKEKGYLGAPPTMLTRQPRLSAPAGLRGSDGRGGRGGIASDATGVYYCSAFIGGITKYAFADGSTTGFGPGNGGLLANGSYVVWLFYDPYHRLFDAGEAGLVDAGTPSQVFWKSGAGGPSMSAGDSDFNIFAVAADQSEVFWLSWNVEQEFSVFAMPLAGGDRRMLTCNIPFASGLAVDDTDVYIYSEDRGPIWKVRKH